MNHQKVYVKIMKSKIFDINLLHNHNAQTKNYFKSCMKFKKLLPLLFFFICASLLGQVKEKYSKKELQSFVKIYKHTLDAPFDIIKSMQKNAPKIAINEARFSEILQAQFAGNTPKLTEIENKEMAKLQHLMELDKQDYDAKLQQYILAQGMPYSKYKEIEKQYHQNPKFQKKINKMQ
jgi:hypothetical protein